MNDLTQNAIDTLDDYDKACARMSNSMADPSAWNCADAKIAAAVFRNQSHKLALALNALISKSMADEQLVIEVTMQLRKWNEELACFNDQAE